MRVLKVKKLSERATLPTRSFPNDAGLDLYASENVFIPAGETVKIPTDIAINIEPGYYAQIQDRSGCAAKGLRVGAGVVDAGYNGHMCVVMHNLNNTDDRRPFHDDLDRTGYKVKAGDRIAQLVVHKIELPTVEEVVEFEPSDRGNQGFNSTGR